MEKEEQNQQKEASQKQQTVKLWVEDVKSEPFLCKLSSLYSTMPSVVIALVGSNIKVYHGNKRHPSANCLSVRLQKRGRGKWTWGTVAEAKEQLFTMSQSQKKCKHEDAR